MADKDVGSMKECIYLVGFMGSGKTTVGRLVASRLGWSFVDLDREVTRHEGCSIAEIFESRGEEYFRRVESERLRAVSTRTRQIVALGGGTYVDEENRKCVEASGLSIFLDAPLKDILARVDDDGERPLFRDKEGLGRLYQERWLSYRMAAVSLHTEDLDPEAIADRILDLVRAS